MTSESFAWGLVVGVGSGFALALGTTALLRKASIPTATRTTMQTNVDPELKQIRTILSTVEGHLSSLVDIQRSVAEKRRIALSRDDENARKPEMESSEGDDEEDDFYDTTSPAEDRPQVEGLSQRIEDFFDEIDALQLDESQYEKTQEKAYKALKRKSTEVQGHPGLLWRQARANVGMTEILKKQGGETQQRKELLDEAMKFSEQSLELDESNWEAQKWFAIAVGSSSEFDGTQKKIEKGHKYKEHIDRAIELNPDEPSLHNLLGRWYFEVASLSWFERKAAAAFYASPPNATYDQSLQSFVTAESIKPGFWKNNQFMIAKCHYQMANREEAKEWLLKAQALPVNTIEDQECQNEIEELLAKL